ncbi:hypothetical protein PF005_g10302 [Phytophthora fragariae]|uniref:PDZ domain-containing protein n=1 Tax=Phytophthora fragariae TaxID=53985 RepID=A0A6A3Y6R5_9STRA|nr:hypothetical protein PF003_g15940 [Phytophthora fragariae]KAE8938609.1 hypothetical protein PF009_g11524 [Phytophthora fragariae]KAE9011982.1 hypothetical protein PF011_g9122 [Phytophthora fragariae]KAE9114136.1 hypothetical protein PF007_g10503 [Phytophthora fragariae]KAE9114503.1 hypothetical protein PF010_g9682 [Phytophthora fragariae]
MKKMSRKNFRAGPLFSSKSSSASSTPTPGSSSSPAGGGGGIMRRATWADKIRDKLPPLGENEYEVLWERGVLGVIFLESEKDGIPYVSKTTESCISPTVSQGDILKFVNVVRSKDHSFSDFFKILATMKKPVLLRFERVSVSTPSSDEDEASQLFGVPRSSSTNAMNSASHYANADEGGDPTGKLSRANSVPQKDQKPPKAMRGAFWRATSAKDSVGPANTAAQSVGPGGVSGGGERLGASRRLPSNRDQVSPRDLAATHGGGGQSSQSPLGLHEYQVYWETGSLGLFFGEDRSTNLPVVTRSTPSANPVVRRAVAINDTLVSANGIRSADYTFEAFFGRLQQMNKPVRLVFRRRQPTDQVVIVKQGEQQQQQQRQKQQLHQPLEQRQQQMREQQQMQEQEQKRELQQARDQQLRDQQQRELLQREQQQEEHQQRELHQREQQQRELQQREQQQRELQQREQQLWEQQQREQEQREQEKRELQLREQQLREQQQREQQQIQEQQKREREQHLLQEQQRQEQEEGQRNRTPSVTVDTTPSPPAPLSQSRMAHRSRTPSPTVKRASTPPPRPPSPQVRLESDNFQREHRHLDRGRTPPPISPVMSEHRASMRQQAAPENVPSTNYEVSPKASVSSLVQSSPRVDISPQFNVSPRASPNTGTSPKVNSSPFTSPMSPFIATEIGSESNGHVSSSVAEVDDDTPEVPSPIETEETVQAQKENPQSFESTHGNRSRNASEEQRLQRTSIPVHEEESVLSPLSKPTHLSPTEPWDLPEQIPSPTIKAEPLIVVDEDEDDDVEIAVPVSPSSDIHVEIAAVAQEDELIEEAEGIEEAEVIKEAGLAEETEIGEDAEFAEEVDFDDEAELAVEAGLAEEAEPVLPSLPVDNSSDDNADLDDVEVGMLADVEVGVAVDEADAEVVESTTSEHDRNSSPWDLEPEPERKKAHRHESNTASPHDEHSSSSTGKPSIDSGVEASEVDFTDASESDEFANDPDISGDIDSVDGDIMMQEAPKDKVDSASPPKPSKSSLHTNLAKYKKKGKTARGVAKLPALTEEEALTVPLVAPNAVNTTVQVRGRPKPKLTMADTPDSTTYLIKWKENRSIGLQLKEVRFAKGTYPLVMDVCQEPCCELLRHICVGDVIIEINGRNTSTMGVKKTVNFLKTCTKTTLMKIRHGPAFVTQRVSATV